MQEVLVITKRDLRAIELKGVAAALSLAVAAVLWYEVLFGVQNYRIPAVSISPLLVKLGTHYCRKNDGLKRIEALMPPSDHYSFVCNDDMRLTDFIAKLKR